MAMVAAVAAIRGRLGLRVEVATVDHQLRAESRSEAELVAATCLACGLSHHLLSGPLDSEVGIEASARHIRYRELDRLRHERGLDFLATAHTANDQAETLLMRLARGASMAGAAGILERRLDGVIRPLLFATRAQVEAYVAAKNLRVARDEMNHDEAFLRVKMRQRVLPALVEAAGPKSVQALARFATLAHEDEAYLMTQAQSARLRAEPEPGVLDARSVSTLPGPVSRRVLALWLKDAQVELDAQLIEDIRAALRDERNATLPKNRVLAYSNGWARIVSAPARKA